jgi:hypothetical protein
MTDGLIPDPGSLLTPTKIDCRIMAERDLGLKET